MACVLLAFAQGSAYFVLVKKRMAERWQHKLPQEGLESMQDKKRAVSLLHARGTIVLTVFYLVISLSIYFAVRDHFLMLPVIVVSGLLFVVSQFFLLKLFSLMLPAKQTQPLPRTSPSSRYKNQPLSSYSEQLPPEQTQSEDHPAESDQQRYNSPRGDTTNEDPNN